MNRNSGLLVKFAEIICFSENISSNQENSTFFVKSLDFSQRFPCGRLPAPLYFSEYKEKAAYWQPFSHISSGSSR